jgi:hypothetical protein
MTDLEGQVVALVVEETHINAKKVHLDSRLSEDIGMESDDAVEFFEKFSEKFHVDLTVLGDHWDQHFLPEGVGVSSLGCMVVIGVGVVAGGLLHQAFKWIPDWMAMIVLVALFCWIYGWIYGKLFGEPQNEKISITVRDLVEAASSCKWVKHYDESAVSLFRTLP